MDGLRIDHVDGLAEPREYCQRLRQRLTELRETAGALQNGRTYVVVEKILGARRTAARRLAGGRHDRLRLHERRRRAAARSGRRRAARADVDRTHRPQPDFADEALRRAPQDSRGEPRRRNWTARRGRLHRIARDSLTTRDFTFTSLRRVLTELVVHFPVYRIYPQNGLAQRRRQRLFRAGAGRRASRAVARGPRRARSRERVARRQRRKKRAAPRTARARRRARPRPQPEGAPQRERARIDRFAAAHRADAVLATDRAGRREGGRGYGVLSLRPAACRATKSAPIRANSRCRSSSFTGQSGALEGFPHAMLATATHDHKRGEDVRARIAVLSEIPDEWGATLRAGRR